jgi:putative membrane protein
MSARDPPGASTTLAVERTFVAYERTLLAWVRTATSLISFGFSIQQFFRIQRAGQPTGNQLLGPQEFGLMMMIIGLLALVLAVLQNRSDLQGLRARYARADGRPMIYRSRALYMAGLIALLGIIGLLSMTLRQR